MINQPIRGAFGDIATVSTPALDRMGAIWYQEEKERKAKALAAEKAEQDDYKEKLTNIRAADVRIYKDLHKKWADARTELIKISKKGDNEAYQKALEDAQDKFAKLNQFVNRSLEEKKNPNRQVPIKDRSDDYDEIMGVYKITPTSELNKTYKTKSGREVVLADVEPLIYRPNQMDYTALGKAGLGTPKKGNLKYVDLGNGERKKVVPEYFNNPVAIADAVANEMIKVRNGVREVETNLGFLEAQQPKIESEFDAYINSPEYKEIYGTDAPTFTQPRTRAEKLIQLFAKDLFLKNKPRFIDGEQETTPQEKLRQKKEADKTNFEQQVTLLKMGADEREKARKAREDFELRKIQLQGKNSKEAQEFDYVGRLADVANYNESRGDEMPFDLKGVKGSVVNVIRSKVPLLDVTGVFKDIGYSSDLSEVKSGDGSKTLKLSKLEAVYKNPKNGHLIVKFNNKEDAAKIMGGNLEDLHNKKGYYELRTKADKDKLLKSVSSFYKFDMPNTELVLNKIAPDQPKTTEQKQPEQKTKAKETSKAKQESKQIKKSKGELDDL